MEPTQIPIPLPVHCASAGPFPVSAMSAMDTQTTQPSRSPFANRPKLSLPGADASQQTTTTATHSGIRILGDSDEGTEEGGMIQLVGGDEDLNASYQISAAGTLRTHGFVLKSSGIQAQPERRHHPQGQAAASSSFLASAASSSSSASSSSAASPGSSADSLPVFNPADLSDLGSVGKGACGVVKRAVHLPSLRILALKTINIYEKVRAHTFCQRRATLNSWIHV